MSEMRFRIPENLNIEEVLKENEKLLNGTKLEKEKLLFICDALLNSRAKYRRQLNEKNESLVPLSTEILQETIHDYPRYLSFLIDSKVFIADLRFTRGKKCRKYKFNSLYEGQKSKEVIVDHYRLKKAYNNALENMIRRMKKKTWGFDYLTKWWDSGKLKIDQEAAFNWIDNYEKQKIDSIKKDGKGKKRARIARAIDTTQDFKQLVLRINMPKAFYHFKGKGHRFYNPITNLKKELRSFLTYDGQPLVEVDKKNSQPFFSTCLFRTSFWEPLEGKEDRNLRLAGISKEIYKEVRRSKRYAEIITLLKTSETLADKGYSAKNFIDLVVEGEFYEFIQKHFEPLFPTRFSDRSKVKKSTLTIFYLDNDTAVYNKPSYKFKELFPEAYELFRLIKSIVKNLLPVILQRIESHLILEVVCKRIALNHPDLPLFTIHDSIITTKGNEGIVEEIMNREIENLTGYKASFEIKDLLPMQAAA